MMRSSITSSEVVEFLNQLLEADRPAVAALIANRVPCNQVLADHPTVQVGVVHGGFSVGMLGIINGLFGTYPDGFGCIAAWYDENKDLVGFSLLPEEEHQCRQE